MGLPLWSVIPVLTIPVDRSRPQRSKISRQSCIRFNCNWKLGTHIILWTGNFSDRGSESRNVTSRTLFHPLSDSPHFTLWKPTEWGSTRARTQEHLSVLKVTFRACKRCLSEFYHRFSSWLAFRVPNFLPKNFHRGSRESQSAEKPISDRWKRGMTLAIRAPISEPLEISFSARRVTCVQMVSCLVTASGVLKGGSVGRHLKDSKTLRNHRKSPVLGFLSQFIFLHQILSPRTWENWFWVDGEN
jgi:hypothetical protein